jgi:NADH:ubiquinone reductase (H+-translocating)
MAPSSKVPAEGSVVVLGAGYAGLTVAEEVHRRSAGSIPITLVDRSPGHVLRTELYQIGEIAGSPGDLHRWIVPLAKVFDRTSVTLLQGTVDSIDLATRTVRVDHRAVPYRALALCLGNVAAYYGVPGAAEHTASVYRLSAAQRTAEALRRVAAASSNLPGEQRPRVLVIGGGSTGTELAAEIATTDWSRVIGRPARRPDVMLVVGAFPFLAGFPPKVIELARRTLGRAGVAIVYGQNVTQVEAGRVHLADGTVLACDLAVWCAGLEAPTVVRALPVPHGRGGRVAVEPTLEVPGFPGVFAVGDAAEFTDPTNGISAPGTAQAALSEARTAARNLVARLSGSPLEPYQYRERGVIVALGLGKGAGRVGGLTLWGNPARWIKTAVEREYSRAVKRGKPSGML